MAHLESEVSVQLSPLKSIAVNVSGFVKSKHLSSEPQSSGSFVQMPESMHALLSSLT